MLFFNATLLLTTLLKDKIYKPGKNWFNFIVKIIFANEMMALFLYVCVDTTQWSGWSALDRSLNLMLWIALGAGVYTLSLLLIGIRPRNFVK